MGCNVSRGDLGGGGLAEALRHRRSGMSGEDLFKNNRFVANLVTVQTAAIVPLMSVPSPIPSTSPVAKSPGVAKSPKHQTTLWGTKLEPRRHSDVTQYCRFKSGQVAPAPIVLTTAPTPAPNTSTPGTEHPVDILVVSDGTEQRVTTDDDDDGDEIGPVGTSATRRKQLTRLNTGEEIEDCYRRMGSSLF
jgi:hypothetical protein